MGFFSDIRSRLVDSIVSAITGGDLEKRVGGIMDRRSYIMGYQKKGIRQRANQPDDNVTANFIRKIVDQSVSLLFGKGIEFDFGEDEGNEAGKELIEGTWKYNKKDILLPDMAHSGTLAGMVFAKLVPNGNNFTRIVNLDPSLMDIITDPHDLSKVIKYIIQYKYVNENDKEVNYREITEWNPTSEDGEQGNWTVTEEEAINGRWKVISSKVWEWTFPPIVHGKNLPLPHMVWGMPDITDDIMELQDRLNFSLSNENKIIRLQAHPLRFVKGTGIGDIAIDPDKLIKLPENGEATQLAPVADIPAISNFALMLRQMMFDNTESIDITSMADKLGALTNFGLHVLFMEALAKLETKRSLYGDFILEINKRLLALANMPEQDIDIVWPNPLPENEMEDAQAAEIALNLGVVSKQTVSGDLGLDWETEKQRMEEEKQGEENIGEFLLRGFNRGGGEFPQPARVENAERIA